MGFTESGPHAVLGLLSLNFLDQIKKRKKKKKERKKGKEREKRKKNYTLRPNPV